jgi:hypothetical protein
MRCLPLPFGGPIGWAPLKYLLDVGFTRDVWAHRVDICAALGKEMHLTADHDGRLVGDMVAECAGLHGEPFDLILTGAAGGALSQGSGGDGPIPAERPTTSSFRGSGRGSADQEAVGPARVNRNRRNAVTGWETA